MRGDDGVPLAGGNMGDVYRHGDTVVRQAGPWTPAVHRLLVRLGESGVEGVPRPLLAFDPSREVLSFIDGDVPTYPLPAWVWKPEALVSAARLLRRIHDATMHGPWDGPWRSATHEPVEVVCHNDFAPYNLVFREGQVVGVIDWDYAAPGPRIWDLAYLAYQLVPLTSTSHSDGFTPAQRETRLALVMDAYGTQFDRAQLLGVVRDRLVDLADFSDKMAVTLSKPELAEHARVYRIDARTIGP